MNPYSNYVVPKDEPALGTVIVVTGKFDSGGGYSTTMLIRTGDGWAHSPSHHDRKSARTWARLTDLETINEGSSVKTVATHVQIVASPLV